MTHDQRTVAVEAASGIAGMIILVWGLAAVIPQPFIADTAADRLAYALRWAVLPALTLLAMIAAVGNARFASEAIDPTLGKESRKMVVDGRVADVYRAGRVLLAGDAAHVHSPAGGQGMNAGILDAARLAEALVEALAGNLSALDAYGAERRPVAREVVALADRLTRLATVRPALRGLRNLVLSTLARLPRFRTQLAWRLSGLVYR